MGVGERDRRPERQSAHAGVCRKAGHVDGDAGSGDPDVREGVADAPSLEGRGDVDLAEVGGSVEGDDLRHAQAPRRLWPQTRTT